MNDIRNFTVYLNGGEKELKQQIADVWKKATTAVDAAKNKPLDDSAAVKFVSMVHIVGIVTETTVALFNSVRSSERDDHGFFIWRAFDFNENGVFAKKVRLNDDELMTPITEIECQVGEKKYTVRQLSNDEIAGKKSQS